MVTEADIRAEPAGERPVRKIALAGERDRESEWTVSVSAIEEIASKASECGEYVMMEQVEAVILAMFDLGYAVPDRTDPHRVEEAWG